MNNGEANAELSTNTPVVSAIVSDGKLIQGVLSDRPVPWWSFTKTVLAAAALALVRDEALFLDRPVTNQPYTLRQLLQHTAGIPSYTDLDAYQPAVTRGETPWKAEEMLFRARASELLFEPGRGWRYSNTGYFRVRQIIEAAAGQEIGQAIERLVLSPLGIDGVFVARTVEEMAATEWGNPTRYDPRWVYHGLLIGSPASAALLLERLLNGDLLPEPLLAEMCTPIPLGHELPGRPCVNFGYGLGLMIAKEGIAGRSCGHTGHDPTSVAAVYHFPDCIPSCTIAAFAPTGEQAMVEWVAHNTAVAISKETL